MDLKEGHALSMCLSTLASSSTTLAQEQSGHCLVTVWPLSGVVWVGESRRGMTAHGLHNEIRISHNVTAVVMNCRSGSFFPSGRNTRRRLVFSTEYSVLCTEYRYTTANRWFHQRTLPSAFCTDTVLVFKLPPDRQSFRMRHLSKRG